MLLSNLRQLKWSWNRRLKRRSRQGACTVCWFLEALSCAAAAAEELQAAKLELQKSLEEQLQAEGRIGLYDLRLRRDSSPTLALRGGQAGASEELEGEGGGLTQQLSPDFHGNLMQFAKKQRCLDAKVTWQALGRAGTETQELQARDGFAKRELHCQTSPQLCSCVLRPSWNLRKRKQKRLEEWRQAFGVWTQGFCECRR